MNPAKLNHPRSLFFSSPRQQFLKIFLFTLALFIVTANRVEATDWNMVWADEFNYQGLPDQTKWDYEVGFVRNHESQYYTRSRLENARVEEGNLVIECRKESFTPANHAPVEYTAASLTTQTKASWQYGRMEVRAKLPQGKGVWPAIWMLGTNISKVGWSACGEIDIMEFVGKEPKGIHGTLHYAVNGKHQSDGGTLQTNQPFAAFHVYAIEWTPERIDFFFDDNKYHTVPIAKADQGKVNPFRAAQYLILNFALGGSWGGPIDDAVLPQKFLVDYVRVYQAADRPKSSATGAK
jgi:beta-glucanase (GH16 family)